GRLAYVADLVSGEAGVEERCDFLERSVDASIGGRVVATDGVEEDELRGSDRRRPRHVDERGGRALVILVVDAHPERVGAGWCIRRHVPRDHAIPFRDDVLVHSIPLEDLTDDARALGSFDQLVSVGPLPELNADRDLVADARIRMAVTRVAL